MKTMLQFVAFVLCFGALASIGRADGIYLTFDGAVQGKFKGDVVQGAHKGEIAALGINFAVTAPVDMGGQVSGGVAEGKSQLGPMTITVALSDVATQFLNAIQTGETLRSVVVEFVRTGPDGKDQTYYTINLGTAVVASVRTYTPQGAATTGPATVLQDISIAYGKFAIGAPSGNSSANSNSGNNGNGNGNGNNNNAQDPVTDVLHHLHLPH